MPDVCFPHFTKEELQRASSPASEYTKMDLGFMERLERARTLAEVPFIINSAYRSVPYELEMGRSGKSYHTLGRAVDIRCIDSQTRFKIVDSLLRVGFTGIGIAPTFIHVDDRKNVEPLIWLYK